MANRYNPLTGDEQTAYNAVARALGDLPTESALKVLKEIALRHDRELVKLGAVRTAAVAASQRRSKESAAETATGKPSKREIDPAYKAWSENQGRALIEMRDSVKGKMPSDPKLVTPEQRARVADLSARIRDAWENFRSHGGPSSVAPAASLSGSAKPAPGPSASSGGRNPAPAGGRGGKGPKDPFASVPGGAGF